MHKMRCCVGRWMTVGRRKNNAYAVCQHFSHRCECFFWFCCFHWLCAHWHSGNIGNAQSLFRPKMHFLNLSGCSLLFVVIVGEIGSICFRRREIGILILPDEFRFSHNSKSLGFPLGCCCCYCWPDTSGRLCSLQFNHPFDCCTAQHHRMRMWLSITIDFVRWGRINVNWLWRMPHCQSHGMVWVCSWELNEFAKKYEIAQNKRLINKLNYICAWANLKIYSIRSRVT